ncbi:MAG: hypothetical protein MUO64_03295 [Anaerolineales bacterium]|nr:hypothetical protein [Anaerolineales bacterium]
MNKPTQTVAQVSPSRQDKHDDILTQAPNPNYRKNTIVVIALIVIVICVLFSPLCYLSIQKAKSSASPIETNTAQTLEAINKTNVVSELNSTTTPNPTDTEEFTTTPTNYSMINKELGSSTKCILHIRLPDRIPEEKIKSLAEYLQENEGKNCFPLYIYYFLPDDVPGTDMAWAYSNFNPELEIKINGLDLETKATLEAIKPSDNENVVGIWLDTGALPHKIVIKKINSSYEMTTTYGDGSGETKILTVKVINDEERLYENPGNYYGDYMVIKSNRNLAFYDNAGLIFELPPE